MLSVLIALIFVVPISAFAQKWNVVLHGDQFNLEYKATGFDSPTEALDAALKGQDLSHLKYAGISSLLDDAGFQKEVADWLDVHAHRAFQRALHSAGNMHNPRVTSLDHSYCEAVLQTSFVRLLNEKLRPFHLLSTKVSIEEFHINRRKEFSGFLGIEITPIKSAKSR